MWIRRSASGRASTRTNRASPRSRREGLSDYVLISQHPSVSRCDAIGELVNVDWYGRKYSTKQPNISLARNKKLPGEMLGLIAHELGHVLARRRRPSKRCATCCVATSARPRCSRPGLVGRRSLRLAARARAAALAPDAHRHGHRRAVRPAAGWRPALLDAARRRRGDSSPAARSGTPALSAGPSRPRPGIASAESRFARLARQLAVYSPRGARNTRRDFACVHCTSRCSSYSRSPAVDRTRNLLRHLRPSPSSNPWHGRVAARRWC